MNEAVKSKIKNRQLDKGLVFAAYMALAYVILMASSAVALLRYEEDFSSIAQCVLTYSGFGLGFAIGFAVDTSSIAFMATINYCIYGLLSILCAFAGIKTSWPIYAGVLGSCCVINFLVTMAVLSYIYTV